VTTGCCGSCQGATLDVGLRIDDAVRVVGVVADTQQHSIMVAARVVICIHVCEMTGTLKVIRVNTEMFWNSITVVVRVFFYTCNCRGTVAPVAFPVELCPCDCKTMMT